MMTERFSNCLFHYADSVDKASLLLYNHFIECFICRSKSAERNVMKKRIFSALLCAIILASTVQSGFAADSPLEPTVDSSLVYDSSLGYVKGISPEDTVATLAPSFENALTVKNASGEDVGADAAVGSDYVLSAGGKEALALLYGDVNRDAKVNAKDISAMLKQSSGADISLCMAAFDVNLDNKTNSKDISYMLKYLSGSIPSVGYEGWSLNLDKVEVPCEDYTLNLFFTNSLTRDDPEAAEITEDYSVLLKLAKSEAESVNANLMSMLGHEGLNVTLSDFTDKFGNTLKTELYWEDYFYVEARGDTVPDRLPPVEKDFSLKENVNQALFIKATTTENSVAGLYRAVLDVKDVSGDVVKRAYVYADVWDFTVPEETHVKTAVGMNAFGILSGHNYKYDDANALYAEYYNYLLSNRINAWCIPYDPSDERADEYLNNPRVNSVLIAGGYSGDLYNNKNESDIAKIYDKFKDNEEWLDKALFYLVDEPLQAKAGIEGDIHDVLEADSMLKRVWNNARQIIPVPVIEEYDLGGEAGDTMTICANHSTVLCPCIRLWPGSSVSVIGVTNHYDSYFEEKYGMWEERVDAWLDEGKEVWWYSGNTPRSPMNNMDLENTGIEMRTLFWNTYHEDVDGWLYWSTVEWGGTTSPLGRKLVGSEGLLVYCGYRYGIDGPVGCLRAEIARDSIEDYEYLWLAEQLWGKEKAMEWAEKVVTNTYTFVRTYDELQAARVELGDALEEAMK